MKPNKIYQLGSLDCEISSIFLNMNFHPQDDISLNLYS